MYSTIIHPTDLSDASIPALKRAYALAKNFGSRLLVCYIARAPMVASGDTITDPNTNETRNISEEVAAIQPLGPEVNSEVRIVTLEESSGIKPLMSILEGMEGELLVLGMHKKKGISGWFGKSITEDVVSKAHTDVLVVKHHDESTE